MQPRSGGGWQAIWYTLRKAREVGGFFKLWRAMRSRNACKTCALGMGGQSGGMVNERGAFPEVCKKSLQAMAADMQGGIRPEFWDAFSIPKLQSLSPRELESLGRLTQPVLLSPGSSCYRPISWPEAVNLISSRLQAIAPRESFWYFSGRSSNEAAFLLQLFARLYGTNNVNNCSFYCHQASGVGLASSLGTGTATLALEDLEHADLIFLIGGNPASNHPRLMTTLMHLRNRGGKVVVINPVIEAGLVNFKIPSNVWSMLFGTRIATQYIQPHIGGDLALLTGIAKRIVECGEYDARFLRDHCEQPEAYLASLRATPWSEIESKSGVALKDIHEIAATYAAAKNVVFAWTMGITHHAHGVQNVQAIANLALLRGMVGRAKSGLLPIRGHSNVQGIGSMGVTPKLKDAIFERLQKHYGLNLPTEAGLDTLACMEQAHTGHLKFGLCLGGNLYGSNPDSVYAANALAKLDLLVYLSTTLNTGHAHGLAKQTLILPVLARDEEPEPTTQESMFNYVRLSEGGPARHTGPLSEIHVVSRIAEAVLGNSGPIPWREMAATNRIREMIARVAPGFEQLSEMGETKKEFTIPGRVLHQPHFPTPSGKARLIPHELPEIQVGPSELLLMTVRSEGQFNTVVYEDYDLYRGQDRRDVILIHPDDLKRLGISPEQRVDVRSATGTASHFLARPFPQIRPGCALMYYPEANILVPRTVDPQSRTPAFKCVVVTIIPAGNSSLALSPAIN